MIVNLAQWKQGARECRPRHYLFFYTLWLSRKSPKGKASCRVRKASKIMPLTLALGASISRPLSSTFFFFYLRRRKGEAKKSRRRVDSVTAYCSLRDQRRPNRIHNFSSSFSPTTFLSLPFPRFCGRSQVVPLNDWVLIPSRTRRRRRKKSFPLCPPSRKQNIREIPVSVPVYRMQFHFLLPLLASRAGDWPIIQSHRIERDALFFLLLLLGCFCRCIP